MATAHELAEQIRRYGYWQGPDAQLDELERRAARYDEMKAIVARVVRESSAIIEDTLHRVALEDRDRVARNRAREARRVKCAADTPPGTRCKLCGEKH